MGAPEIDILMYHSISDGAGPTNIAPRLFRDHMTAIAEAGIPVISLDDLASARDGGKPLPARAIVLTFDDGFEDFADTAWPVIREHGWPVCVYLPTAYMGGLEGWRGIIDPPRPLMSWETVVALSVEGVTFGGHTVTHPDLTELDPGTAATEIRGSSDAIAAQTGHRPAHFAPPYGASTKPIRDVIARSYRTSCGTELGQAGPTSDAFNLPRLEMFYFRQSSRWRAHLAGRGATYLATRRALRTVRDRLQHPWARA